MYLADAFNQSILHWNQCINLMSLCIFWELYYVWAIEMLKHQWPYIIYKNAKNSFTQTMRVKRFEASKCLGFTKRKIKCSFQTADNSRIWDKTWVSMSEIEMPAFHCSIRVNENQQKRTNIHGMSEMLASGLLLDCRWRAERLGEGGWGRVLPTLRTKNQAQLCPIHQPYEWMTQRNNWGSQLAAESENEGEAEKERCSSAHTWRHGNRGTVWASIMCGPLLNQ